MQQCAQGQSDRLIVRRVTCIIFLEIGLTTALVQLEGRMSDERDF